MSNLLRNAIRTNSLLRSTTSSSNQCFPSLLRQFSTEAEQHQDSPVDPFLQTPKTGVSYGRLLGINKHTLKTDVVRMLEGCNLTLDDVKVDYNNNYMPISMMVQFPSRQAFENSFRLINKQGRLYKLEKADLSQWDTVTSYGGKAILLQGIPRNALQDDVDRFLSGCGFDSSSLQLFVRPGFPDPVRMAVVHFCSPTQAMNAFLTKNRGFCLNNQILMRVLQ